MSDFTRDAGNNRAAKVALRNQLLALRRSKSPELLAAAATHVLHTLEALVRQQSPKVIAAYVPLGAEPGGRDLPESLAQAVPGATVLLPALLPDGDLDWARYEGPQSLHRAARGLLEPAGARLGCAAVTQADLVVVPALAVDHHGVRMGRGGGSYDRALARVSGTAFTLALLHDGELLARVPAEPHDCRVKAVITPTEGLSESLDWTK
ncbi:5-formyltetrahydrofolate cyclo-ligase [Actinoplanes sp. NPDC051859]|uniref:5-formyltetrahydrofolate cyclo-ligase n=1 Tax=Actinoplanes sp. NPDC051859 TaxID=3363909 RepID=UPI0037AD9CAC